MLKQFKIIVEKHADGYIAYPLGIKGVVVGEGDSYEEALADVKSAIQFHIETFGADGLDIDSPVLEAFVASPRLAHPEQVADFKLEVVEEPVYTDTETL
jgi:predicted RNase H-like HicB family nuclease